MLIVSLFFVLIFFHMAHNQAKHFKKIYFQSLEEYDLFVCWSVMRFSHNLLS